MIIYGKQLILYVLEKHSRIVKTVYLSKTCDKDLFSRLARLGAKIVKVDTMKAQALAKGGNHQGFLMEIEPIETITSSELKSTDTVLALDGLSDMGNIGAIVRTAYVLGIGGIVIGGIKHLSMESIIRTSSGAALDMPIALSHNLLDLVNEFKQVGFKVYGTQMNAKEHLSVKFSKKCMLVLGSENKGISPKLLNKCDELVSIRMVRAFDSLNVSATAAILCNRIANG